MAYPKQKRTPGPLIYLFTFPNGKCYVGQTVQSFEERMTKHKSAAKNRQTEGCMALNAAINKYKWDDIKKEVLMTCTVDKLDEYEMDMIKAYDSISPNGYNLLSGGNSNKTQHSSMKEKTSLSHIRNSMKENPDRVRYGCIYKHSHRTNGRQINAYSIVDHPLLEFKTFKTYEDDDSAVEALNNLNITASIKKVDVSEHEVGVGLEYSSKNTHADIKDVLNTIVDTIADKYKTVDKYKRIKNAKVLENLDGESNLEEPKKEVPSGSILSDEEFARYLLENPL